MMSLIGAGFWDSKIALATGRGEARRRTDSKRTVTTQY